MNPVRKRDERTKLRLLLTPSELRKLDAVVSEAGVNRSFLILEALKVGLSNPDLNIDQERRNQRVDAWATDAIKEHIRQLATHLHITQQHLTRHLLLRYLATAPWNAKQTKQPIYGGLEAAN